MIASRTQIALVAGFLILVGLGITLYKTTVLGFPILPGESREVWTIESKVSFQPSGRQSLQAEVAGLIRKRRRFGHLVSLLQAA